MIRRILFITVLLISVTVLVFARGSGEETEVQTQNNEWLLCITNFDTSNLAEERKAVSDVTLKKLAELFSSINYRTRVAGEYAYYEDYAWSQTRANTARALVNKQNERSLLLFRGESNWRYMTNLARLNEEIETLRGQLEEIDNNPPVINKEPNFNLVSANLDNMFPSAPVSGNEYRFCVSQKADAVLIGSIQDYYGRFLLSLRLYTIYTRSFIWEDRIVFSHDDIDSAIDEISRRLMILLSGNRPGAVEITAQPDDTLVLINRSFAGRGETSVLEFPPGRINVIASSPDHHPISFDTILVPGELSRITINLEPIEYGELEITGTENGFSGSVYHGAMYVGEAPLTLLLPLNYMEYFEIETAEGESGRIIYQTPDTQEFTESLSIAAALPPPAGMVDRARRTFYWSFGGTWLAGITAWITNYMYNTMAVEYNRSPTQALYDDAVRMQGISRGAIITLGALGVLDIILIIRYVYLASKGNIQFTAGGY